MNQTNAATAFADMPEKLAGRLADLNAAMVQPQDPSEWPTGEAMLEAHAPKAIAKIVAGAFHPMLTRRAIAYLWREKMERNGKTTLGKASKASGKVKYFGDVDFVIEFNFDAWQLLSPRERIALVDHELMHCAVDGESMKPIMVPHDVEEFGSIVARWGLWQPDLERFGEVVREAGQMSLFEVDDAVVQKAIDGALDKVERAANGASAPGDDDTTITISDGRGRTVSTTGAGLARAARGVD